MGKRQWGVVWAVIKWSSKILPKEGSHLSQSADFCYEKCTSCPSGIRIPQQNIPPDHLSVTSALQAGIWKFGSGFTSALQICHTIWSVSFLFTSSDFAQHLVCDIVDLRSLIHKSRIYLEGPLVCWYWLLLACENQFWICWNFENWMINTVILKIKWCNNQQRPTV